MKDHPALRALRERTAPPSDAVVRVRQRLDTVLVPATQELAELPLPSPQAVDRVRQRLRTSSPPRAFPRRWAVAGGMLLMGMGAFAAWVSQSAAPARPLDVALTPHEAAVDLAPGVRITAMGTGHATGTLDLIVIDWESGRLALDTEGPVQVRTGEGMVHSPGGAVVLTRDALGTSIISSTAQLRVVCHAGGPNVCLPTTPAGWLARGQALTDPTAAAEALEEGLSQPSAPELRAELHAARIGPLLTLGRTEEALRAAELALATPGPRAESLHRAAARLRLLLDPADCGGARPHLEALTALTDTERAHLARCGQP